MSVDLLVLCAFTVDCYHFASVYDFGKVRSHYYDELKVGNHCNQ